MKVFYFHIHILARRVSTPALVLKSLGQ